MKLSRPLAALALVGVIAALAAGCGGKKRPPEVATAPTGTAAGTGGPSTYEPATPLEPGPDVRPVESEGLGATDIMLGRSGSEGGPLADVRFAYDEASLSDEARATLERHALWLQTNREVRVTIEGHCDERGTIEYNLALGDQRARAAHEYLVGLGVAPERLTTVSYGKERPLDAGHDESAWARNRRAAFVVSR